jgi:hypothetical protein
MTIAEADMVNMTDEEWNNYVIEQEQFMIENWAYINQFYEGTVLPRPHRYMTTFEQDTTHSR